MTAYGYKRTLLGTVIYFRFTPESGHSEGSRRMSVNDPKRKSMISGAGLVAGKLLMGLSFDAGGPREGCRPIRPLLGWNNLVIRTSDG